jgi:hypothetical protein
LLYEEPATGIRRSLRYTKCALASIFQVKRVVYFGSMGEKAANVGRGITNEPNLPSSEALGINHRPGQGHSVVLFAFWRPLQGEFYPLPVIKYSPCGYRIPL